MVEETLPGLNQPPSKQRARRYLVRFTIGITLLVVLIVRVGGRELRDAFISASAAPVVLAFLLMVIGVCISVVRWSVFLNALGYARSLGRLTRLYWTGLFFSSLLPTGIGGDVYKAVRVRSEDDPFGPAFASVILDRLAGLVGLALLAIVAGTVRIAQGDRNAVVLWGLGLAALVVVGILILPVSRRLIPALSSLPGLRSIAERLSQVLEGLTSGTRDRSAVVLGLLAGVLFQAIVVAFHALLVRSLDLSIPIGGLVSIVMVATVASLIPLTVNGLGIREGVYVWGLGRYGIESHAALALALLVLGLLLAASVAGGIVYIVGGDRSEIDRPLAG